MAVLALRQEADPDTQTPVDPPSPGSYWFPLLVIVLVCAGYVAWRRKRNQDSPFGSNDFARGSAAVRLSMDDDGPAATSFIMNNGSNESLPSHALSDLPVLPQSQDGPEGTKTNLTVHPAYQDRSISPTPSYTSTPDLSGMPSTGLSRTGSSTGPVFPGLAVGQKGGKSVGGGRRSARRNAPVEGGDGESDSEVEVGTRGKDVFGIGDEDEDDEDHGPLGRT